jgi:hypothetical protein
MGCVPAKACEAENETENEKRQRPSDVRMRVTMDLPRKWLLRKEPFRVWSLVFLKNAVVANVEMESAVATVAGTIVPKLFLALFTAHMNDFSGVVGLIRELAIVTSQCDSIGQVALLIGFHENLNGAFSAHLVAAVADTGAAGLSRGGKNDCEQSRRNKDRGQRSDSEK